MDKRVFNACREASASACKAVELMLDYMDSYEHAEKWVISWIGAEIQHYLRDRSDSTPAQSGKEG